MGIVRLNQLPDGSGNLTNDDIFVFMDDPSGSGITKKISLSEISSAIGGGGGGNPFDQNLNTNDNVTFSSAYLGELRYSASGPDTVLNYNTLDMHTDQGSISIGTTANNIPGITFNDNSILTSASGISGGGGSSDPKVIYYSGVFPSTIHNLDHQDADMIVFNLKDNTNIPTISGYLSLTGMKAGKDGQIVKLVNITDYTVPSTGTFTYKNIYVFNSVLGSGSLPENRFDAAVFNASYRPINSTAKAAVIYFNGHLIECIYSNSVQKWLITSGSPIFVQAISSGSVGGGGV